MKFLTSFIIAMAQARPAFIIDGNGVSTETETSFACDAMLKIQYLEHFLTYF